MTPYDRDAGPLIIAYCITPIIPIDPYPRNTMLRGSDVVSPRAIRAQVALLFAESELAHAALSAHLSVFGTLLCLSTTRVYIVCRIGAGFPPHCPPSQLFSVVSWSLLGCLRESLLNLAAMEHDMASAGTTGAVSAMFDQAADGHYTFTDSELHELLGVVINNETATNADDCAFHKHTRTCGVVLLQGNPPLALP